MNEYIRTNKRGDRFYFKDKAMTILHREDGPAAEWYEGSKTWYKNGKRHRMDDPAFEHVNGSKSWCINDVLIFTIDKSGKIVNINR